MEHNSISLSMVRVRRKKKVVHLTASCYFLEVVALFFAHGPFILFSQLFTIVIVWYCSLIPICFSTYHNIGYLMLISDPFIMPPHTWWGTTYFSYISIVALYV